MHLVLLAMSVVFLLLAFICGNKPRTNLIDMKKIDLHLGLFALSGAFLLLAFIGSGDSNGWHTLSIWSKINAAVSVVCFVGGLVVYVVEVIKAWLRKF